MRISTPGPVRVQRNGLAPGGISRIIRRGQGQRRQPVPGFAPCPERLPAGRQHPHVITGRQQPGAQLRGRAGHVLAVIQHQQQLPPGQHPRQRLGGRHPRLLPYPHRRGHCRRYLRRVRYRCQFRQPCPVREPARHLPRHLIGQPGLTRAARPGNRHQPVLIQQPRHLTHRPGPADETGQRNRKAMHPTHPGGHRRPPHARTITAGRPSSTAQSCSARSGTGPAQTTRYELHQRPRDKLRCRPYRFALRLGSRSVTDHDHEPPPGGCGGQAAVPVPYLGYLAAPAT